MSGATSYRIRARVNASTLGDWDKELTKTVTETRFDARALLNGLSRKSQAYQFEVTAMSGGSEMATGQVNYFFTSSRKDYGEIRNLRWNGTVASWDAVPGASVYFFALYRSYSAGTGMFNVIYTQDLSATSIDVAAIKTKSLDVQKELKENYQFLFKVCARGNENYFQSAQYTSEWVMGKELLNGHRTKGEISGEASIDIPYPGYYLRPRYSGVLYEEFRLNENNLHHQWQRSTGANGVFRDIDGETERTYVVSDYDIGDTLRVRIKVDGYQGYVYSNAVQVQKGFALPAVAPELSAGTDSLTVTNGQAHQQYLVSASALDGISESQWAGAASPSADGAFRLSCTPNAVNYVYTRSMATDTRDAGTEVLSAEAYVGAGNAFTLTLSAFGPVGDGRRQDLRIDFEKRETVIREEDILRDYSENANYQVGDVVMLRVDAEPSDSFEGIRGDHWYYGSRKDMRELLHQSRTDVSAGRSRAGSTGFYADPACKTPLQANRYYTCVYAPLLKAGSGMEFGVSCGWNGKAVTASTRVNVADESGKYEISMVILPQDVEIVEGGTLTNLQVGWEPRNVPLKGVVIRPADANNYAPVVTFDEETSTLTVNASDAKAGKYHYYAYTDGNEQDDMFITVVEKVVPPVEELVVYPEELYLAPGESAALEIRTYPMGCEPKLSITSSNSSLAAVNGSVVSVPFGARTGIAVAVRVSEAGSGLVSVVSVNIVDSSEAGVGSDGAETPEKPETPAVPGKESRFSDVPGDAYYFDAVSWAVDEGVTKGTSDTTFSPADTLTRAQAVTFLWRAKGSPAPKTTNNPFNDVSSGTYYYNAVLWAVENGITNGMSEAEFGVDGDVTRGQMITFLWRTEGKPSDIGGEWYESAENWATSLSLLSGTAVKYSTDGKCPRSDVVYYLYRDLAK